MTACSRILGFGVPFGAAIVLGSKLYSRNDFQAYAESQVNMDYNLNNSHQKQQPYAQSSQQTRSGYFSENFVPLIKWNYNWDK